MYRKQLRKVPPAAPTGFIPESWRKLVLTPSGIDRKYYEFCVLNELKGALRSGDIWVKGSRRYKNFDDYLIPAAEFESSRHNDQLQLAVQTDCQAYLQARMTLLASRLEEVNAMALAGQRSESATSGRILGRRDNIVVGRAELSGRQSRTLCWSGQS